VPNKQLRPDFVFSVELLLEQERRLLEFLLDDLGLASLRARAPAHPAVVQHEMITGFLTKSHGLHYPNEIVQVLEIGRALLDSMSLGHNVSLESIVEAIDDPEVLRQLRLRVADPGQFADQMATFTCWNLLRANGFQPRLVEKVGLPDIVLPLASGSQEWMECKRIRLGSGPGRVRKVIGKGNKQIKRAEPDGVGAIYLFVERPQQRLVFDDTVPDTVQTYILEVERELRSGYSRSVAAVVIGWDDYMILGAPPELTLYFLRRRSAVLRHRAPRRQLTLPGHALALERTIFLGITTPSGSTERRGHLEPIRSKNFTVTQQFREVCELPGDVRSVQAIEAMRQPDRLATYDLGNNMSIVLATKWIGVAAEPYMMLLFAVIREVDEMEIHLGFRLYPNGHELTKETHPFDALMQFLARYGLAVRVANQEGLLLARAQVTLPAKGDEELVKVRAEPEENLIVSAAIRIQNTTPQIADVAWAFAISVKRYRADLARHRR
jgi:hypothetical protein